MSCTVNRVKSRTNIIQGQECHLRLIYSAVDVRKQAKKKGLRYYYYYILLYILHHFFYSHLLLDSSFFVCYLNLLAVNATFIRLVMCIIILFLLCYFSAFH